MSIETLAPNDAGMVPSASAARVRHSLLLRTAQSDMVARVTAAEEAAAVEGAREQRDSRQAVKYTAATVDLTAVSVTRAM